MGNQPSLRKKQSEYETEDLRIGTAEMMGWRPEMEDACVCCESLPQKPDCALLAVFDGHGGKLIAEQCAERVVDVLVNVPGYREAQTAGEWEAVCYELFVNLDQTLKNEVREEDGSRTGATAAVVIVTPNTIISASAGDSRAVLAVEGGNGHKCLSADHKPTQDEETRRIEDAGAAVLLGRVNGELAVSRAFGDFSYKTRDDLPMQKQAVTAAPSTSTHPRDGNEQAIVIACDGIWDVMDNQEVADFVRHRLEKGRRDMKKLCASLVDTCLGEGSRDNMTVIIGAFKSYLNNLGGDKESPPPSPCPHDFRDVDSGSDDEGGDAPGSPEEEDDDDAAHSPSDDEEEHNPSYANQEGATYRVKMNTTASDDEQVATLEEALRKSEQEEKIHDIKGNSEEFDSEIQLGHVMRLNGTFQSEHDEDCHVSSVVSSTDSEGSRSSGGPDQREGENSLWQNGGGNHVLNYSSRKAEPLDGNGSLGKTIHSIRGATGSSALQQNGAFLYDESKAAPLNDDFSKSTEERRRRAHHRFLSKKLEHSLNSGDRKDAYLSTINSRTVNSSGIPYNPKTGDQPSKTWYETAPEKARVRRSNVEVQTGHDVDVIPSTHQQFYSPIPVIKVGSRSSKQASSTSRSKSIQRPSRRPKSEKTSRVETNARPQKETSKQRRAVSSTPRARSARPKKRKSQPSQSERRSNNLDSSSRRMFARDIDPVEPTWISRFLKDNTDRVAREKQTSRPVPRPQAPSRDRQRVPNATTRKTEKKSVSRNPIRAGKGHENSNTRKETGAVNTNRSKQSLGASARPKQPPSSSLKDQNASASANMGKTESRKSSNHPSTSTTKIANRTRNRSKGSRRHQRVIADNSILAQ